MLRRQNAHATCMHSHNKNCTHIYKYKSPLPYKFSQKSARLGKRQGACTSIWMMATSCIYQNCNYDCKVDYIFQHTETKKYHIENFQVTPCCATNPLPTKKEKKKEKNQVRKKEEAYDLVPQSIGNNICKLAGT